MKKISNQQTENLMWIFTHVGFVSLFLTTTLVIYLLAPYISALFGSSSPAYISARVGLLALLFFVIIPLYKNYIGIVFSYELNEKVIQVIKFYTILQAITFGLYIPDSLYLTLAYTSFVNPFFGNFVGIYFVTSIIFAIFCLVAGYKRWTHSLDVKPRVATKTIAGFVCVLFVLVGLGIFLRADRIAFFYLYLASYEYKQEQKNKREAVKYMDEKKGAYLKLGFFPNNLNNHFTTMAPGEKVEVFFKQKLKELSATGLSMTDYPPYFIKGTSLSYSCSDSKMNDGGVVLTQGLKSDQLLSIDDIAQLFLQGKDNNEITNITKKISAEKIDGQGRKGIFVIFRNLHSQDNRTQTSAWFASGDMVYQISTDSSISGACGIGDKETLLKTIDGLVTY